MEITRVHDIVIVHLWGEVTFNELPEISETLRSLCEGGNAKVLLDMTAVEHVHYLVFRKLGDIAAILRVQGGDLKIAGLSPENREILRFTGMDSSLEAPMRVAEGILGFVKPAKAQAVMYH